MHKHREAAVGLGDIFRSTLDICLVYRDMAVKCELGMWVLPSSGEVDSFSSELDVLCNSRTNSRTLRHTWISEPCRSNREVTSTFPA
jgi:hypothetical protein